VSRLIILLAALAVLSACSAPDSRDVACAAQAKGSNLPWAYYPSYGCGPVPPAQTVYP
jgi:ABC-type glycerol-3-phosphate transport system substrate-binding protein